MTAFAGPAEPLQTVRLRIHLDDIAVKLAPYRSWTRSVLHDVTSGQLAVPYVDAWLRDDA
jgi:hypothetical protein